jgi:hypothetical protein
MNTELLNFDGVKKVHTALSKLFKKRKAVLSDSEIQSYIDEMLNKELDYFYITKDNTFAIKTNNLQFLKIALSNFECEILNSNFENILTYKEIRTVKDIKDSFELFGHKDNELIIYESENKTYIDIIVLSKLLNVLAIYGEGSYIYTKRDYPITAKIQNVVYGEFGFILAPKLNKGDL